ncbi:MAG: hypothetical protein JO131_04810 [Gammaproteobacteria bacterium]|nr:hypothetical protein [Gammaproteobacteria bacterium]
MPNQEEKVTFSIVTEKLKKIKNVVSAELYSSLHSEPDIQEMKKILDDIGGYHNQLDTIKKSQDFHTINDIAKKVNLFEINCRNIIADINTKKEHPNFEAKEVFLIDELIFQEIIRRISQKFKIDDAKELQYLLNTFIKNNTWLPEFINTGLNTHSTDLNVHIEKWDKIEEEVKQKINKVNKQTMFEKLKGSKDYREWKIAQNKLKNISEDQIEKIALAIEHFCNNYQLFASNAHEKILEQNKEEIPSLMRELEKMKQTLYFEWYSSKHTAFDISQIQLMLELINGFKSQLNKIEMDQEGLSENKSLATVIAFNSLKDFKNKLLPFLAGCENTISNIKNEKSTKHDKKNDAYQYKSFRQIDFVLDKDAFLLNIQLASEKVKLIDAINLRDKLHEFVKNNDRWLPDFIKQQLEDNVNGLTKHIMIWKNAKSNIKLPRILERAYYQKEKKNSKIAVESMAKELENFFEEHKLFNMRYVLPSPVQPDLKSPNLSKSLDSLLGSNSSISTLDLSVSSPIGVNSPLLRYPKSSSTLDLSTFPIDESKLRSVVNHSTSPTIDSSMSSFSKADSKSQSILSYPTTSSGTFDSSMSNYSKADSKSQSILSSSTSQVTLDSSMSNFPKVVSQSVSTLHTSSGTLESTTSSVTPESSTPPVTLTLDSSISNFLTPESKSSSTPSSSLLSFSNSTEEHSVLITPEPIPNIKNEQKKSFSSTSQIISGQGLGIEIKANSQFLKQPEQPTSQTGKEKSLDSKVDFESKLAYFLNIEKNATQSNSASFPKKKEDTVQSESTTTATPVSPTRTRR